MKKISAVIISLVAAVSLLACNQDVSSSSDRSIRRLEQQNEELEAENSELRAQLGMQEESSEPEPGKDTGESINEGEVSYVPGVYTTSLILKDQTVDIAVVVDENNINSISIVNLDEAITTMYPLIEPSLNDIANQILEKQSLNGITYPEDNRYTTEILLDAIEVALKKAVVTGSAEEWSDRKLREVEFTVLAEDEIPPEFLEVITGKQADPFKLTYTTDQYLYIAAGYGKQESVGYSIAVKDFYMTENGLIFDTELIDPSASKNIMPGASYPYIVIKTEKTDATVIFQ